MEVETLRMRSRYRNLDQWLKEMITDDQKRQETSMYEYKYKPSVHAISNSMVNQERRSFPDFTRLANPITDMKSLLNLQFPTQNYQQKPSLGKPTPIRHSPGPNRIEIEMPILKNQPIFTPNMVLLSDQKSNKDPFTFQEVIPEKSDVHKSRIEFQIKSASDTKHNNTLKNDIMKDIFKALQTEDHQLKETPTTKNLENTLPSLKNPESIEIDFPELDFLMDFNAEDYMLKPKLNGKRGGSFSDEENTKMDLAFQTKKKLKPTPPQEKIPISPSLNKQNQIPDWFNNFNFNEQDQAQAQEKSQLGFTLPKFKSNFFPDKLN